MRVIVIDTPSVTVHAIVRAIQRGMESVATLDTATEAPRISRTASLSNFAGASTLVNYLKNLPAEETPYDNESDTWQGIREFELWLRHRVAVILARFGRQRRRAARVVFQPCWRAGRWKSLT